MTDRQICSAWPRTGSTACVQQYTTHVHHTAILSSQSQGDSVLRKPVCSTDQPKLHRQDCASLLGPYTQGKVEVQQGSPLILMESWSGVVGCWTAQGKLWPSYTTVTASTSQVTSFEAKLTVTVTPRHTCIGDCFQHPVCFLTNSGGYTEGRKAEQLTGAASHLGCAPS